MDISLEISESEEVINFFYKTLSEINKKQKLYATSKEFTGMSEKTLLKVADKAIENNELELAEALIKRSKMQNKGERNAIEYENNIRKKEAEESALNFFNDEIKERKIFKEENNNNHPEVNINLEEIKRKLSK